MCVLLPAAGDGCLLGCATSCGKTGHRARDCRGGGGGGRERGGGRGGRRPQPYQFDGECNNCGETGHRARDCPTGNGGGTVGGFEGTCDISGEVGHRKRECPNNGGGDGGSGNSEGRGFIGDHDDRGSRRPGDWTCPNCGSTVFASKMSCYKCSERKPGGGNRGKGKGGKGRMKSNPPKTPSDLDNELDSYFNRGSGGDGGSTATASAPGHKANLDDDLDDYFNKAKGE